MSANTPTTQAPPPHQIPDSAIDALFGRGLDRASWRVELERNGYAWVPGLKDRIIGRELWFFKDEIGRLLSAPNTNKGRKFKSNSRKSILKQIKGKNWRKRPEIDRGDVVQLRTFQDYIKRWQAEDPSYGAPAETSACINDIETPENQPFQSSNHQVNASRHSIAATMTDPRQFSSWDQPKSTDYDLTSDVDEGYGQPSDAALQARTAATKYLQWEVTDSDTIGEPCHPQFEAPPLNESPLQAPWATGDYSQHEFTQGDLPSYYCFTTDDQWAELQNFIPSTPILGHDAGSPFQKESHEAITTTPSNHSLPNQILLQDTAASHVAGTNTVTGLTGDQNLVDGATVYGTLKLDPSPVPRDFSNVEFRTKQRRSNVANPQQSPIIPSVGTQSTHKCSEASQAYAHCRDTEMIDVEHSHFSDDDDDDDEIDEHHDAQATAPRKKRTTLYQKPMRRSNSALREARLRQRVIRLKSEARSTREGLVAELFKKDCEILELAKTVKLLEILSKSNFQDTDDPTVIPSNEHSTMDDIIYQDIVHQRCNNKIIQEARAMKQKGLAQKALSEASFTGTATDDEVSPKESTSPSRHVSRIGPSKGAIPIGHALRFTNAPIGNLAQRPDSNKVEQSSGSWAPMASSTRRAGRSVRQNSDTILDIHRESIPPKPILIQWRQVHDEIHKRYTSDSGYESTDLPSVRSSMATGDEELCPDQRFGGNFI